jgi:hypothetical protein
MEIGAHHASCLPIRASSGEWWNVRLTVPTAVGLARVLQSPAQPDDGGSEAALHGFHVSPVTFHHLPFAPLRLCIKV